MRTLDTEIFRMNSLLLKNCRILLPDHSVVDGNILIENGKIAAIGEIPEGVQVSETKDQSTSKKSLTKGMRD